MHVVKRAQIPISKNSIKLMSYYFQTDCGAGIPEYARAKRNFESDATLYEEMPLQTAIIVRSPESHPSSLISANDLNGKIIVAGIDDGKAFIYD